MKRNNDEMNEDTSIYEDEFLETDDETIEMLKEEIIEEETKNPYFTTTEGLEYDSEGIYAYYDFRNEASEDDDTKYYLKIFREDFRTNQPKYCFTWVKYEEGKYKQLSKIFSNGKTPTEEDSDRNKKLGQYAFTVGLPRDKGVVKDFLEETYLKIIQDEGLEILKDKSFEEVELNDEASEDDDDESERKPSCFEDYPEGIRNKALEILENEDLIERIIKTVANTVEGNEKEIRKFIINLGAIFVRTPIHTIIEGISGVGKTKTMLETLKNYPERLVHILRTVSPKNIYYDKDSYNQDFNILFIDDAQLNDSSVEVLKELSDNEKKIKELKTVNRENGTNKALTYRLEGLYSVNYSYAKNQPDEELINRFFNMGIRNSKEEKKAIKNRIKDNTIVNSDYNLAFSLTNQIIQCCIDYLLGKEVKFYNPYSNLLEVENIANRDISSIINGILSISFYHQLNRKIIKLKDETIVLGSLEDYTNVIELYGLDEVEQRFKLDETQKQVLELVPFKTEEDVIDEIDKMEKVLTVDSKGYRDNEIKKLCTYKSITEKIEGKSETTIKRALSYSENNKQTLEDLGLVKHYELEVNRRWPLKVFYREKETNEEEASKSEISIHSFVQNQFELINNSLYNKMKIIIKFLYSFNILINYSVYIYVKEYCEEYPYIASDEEMFNFINGFCTKYEDELVYLNIDEISMSELDFHNEANKNIYIYDNYFLDNSECNMNIKENPLNKKQKKKNPFNQEMNGKNKYEILIKEVSDVIENLDDEVSEVFNESDEKVLTSEAIVNTIFRRFSDIIEKLNIEQFSEIPSIANDLKGKVEKLLHENDNFISTDEGFKKV